MSTENAFQPYISDEQGSKMPEFTWSAVLLGTLLGIVFAASSLYLVLKVGITVSASIPVAVLAITLFRSISNVTGLRRATILENNIVQTAGSAGESIAFGVGVTMPALLLIGYSMDLSRIMVVSILGGLLGILAMIPLRRAFIVKMHGRAGQPGTLLFPEGTACAQVLISGEKGGTTGKTVFIGFFIAFLHKFLTEGMALLASTVKLPFTFINKMAVFAHEMASELLGVGYIIGLRTSAIMMAGAFLGYLVIIPTIYFIGENSQAVVKPGNIPISQMGLKDIRNNYLLYIGAGCVATAGIISMLKTLPVIVRGFAGGLGGLGGGAGRTRRRTETDLSMKVVFLGAFALVAVLALFLMSEVGVIAAVAGALLVVIFGFLFVTVSSRLTGEIGSSSNPISGMTTATLMLTCLIFLVLGWQSSTDRLVALSIAAVVCIASSNGGTTAQSLKTGFLVGGTPKFGQYAILIGALISALVIGGTLLLINESKSIYSRKAENVPNLVLNKAELDRLTETTNFEGKSYKIWHTRNSNLIENDSNTKFTAREEVQKAAQTKPGMYLVDASTGKVEILKDNNIMGKLSVTDDGREVSREFEAPKTQVMGIVINGVLKGDLNWSMIGIGAMIAFMLELAGVSALAFAVGVYVPIQYSAPIFIGGVIRWLVDKYLSKQSQAEAETNLQQALAKAGNDPVARMNAEKEAKAQAEIDAIRKSETSGGVLLASGYIAGGSLAAVLLGFLAFSDNIPGDLQQWENRKYALTAPDTLENAAKKAAMAELRLTAEPADEAGKQKLEGLTKTIAGMNGNLLTEYATVKAGTVLKVSATKTKTVEKDSNLGDIAETELGRFRKAGDLFKQNDDKLATAATIPAGAGLKLPTSEWPAWVGFLVLCVILLLVGVGKLFKSDEKASQKEAEPVPV